MSRVALIATVYNEADGLESWIEAVDAQTRQPDEIVIVDAGSTDGTLQMLEGRAESDSRWRVVCHSGANVPQGRNIAIRAVTAPIVAITDAGTLAEPTWLEALVAPLDDDDGVGVVGGFFAPDGRTPFERVMATVITPRRPEIDPATFLPSSRSIALRREWWERVGGYPDWLRAGEDLVFSMRLREAGAAFAFQPDAVVRWFPRPTLLGFARQYRHYARGDGHAHLWTKRHVARYGAYATGAALVLGARRRPWLLIPTAFGFGGYLRKFVWRVSDERPFPGDKRATAWAYACVPLVVVAGDLAKIVGYPQGLWERQRAGGAEGLEDAPIASHRTHGDAGDLRIRRA